AGEQVELEADAGMAGGHDPVVHELAAGIATEMAVQADGRSCARIVERNHAAPDVRRVRPADRIMARQPPGRRAMAPLAADAIRGLEARTSLAGGGVTAQAQRRGRWIADAESRRYRSR